LPLFIKEPLKEGFRLLLFAWVFALEGFLGFGVVLLLWAFWCVKFLEGKRITEGKRIAKGKRITERSKVDRKSTPRALT
jgi:hypothetical protein